MDEDLREDPDGIEKIVAMVRAAKAPVVAKE